MKLLIAGKASLSRGRGLPYKEFRQEFSLPILQEAPLDTPDAYIKAVQKDGRVEATIRFAGRSQTILIHHNGATSWHAERPPIKVELTLSAKEE